MFIKRYFIITYITLHLVCARFGVGVSFKTGFSFPYVSVLPEVEPFSITDNTLNEGGSTKILCTASSGDLPMRFVWTKNGRMVNTTNGNNFKIRQLDEMTSIFSLTRVSLEDTGNYSCVAQNEAGSASHTASLKVTGKKNTTLLEFFMRSSLYLSLSLSLLISFLYRFEFVIIKTEHN